jgi:MinD superfamily P-loop ATPase
LEVIESVLRKLKIGHDLIVNRSTISKRRVKHALMQIPYDKKMIECYVDGVPIVERYPENPISKDFFKLAEKMVR